MAVLLNETVGCLTCVDGCLTGEAKLKGDGVYTVTFGLEITEGETVYIEALPRKLMPVSVTESGEIMLEVTKDTKSLSIFAAKNGVSETVAHYGLNLTYGTKKRTTKKTVAKE